MADLEPIAPLIPTLPPAKGTDKRRKSRRGTEEPDRKDVGRDQGNKRPKPDDSDNQVDDYA